MLRTRLHLLPTLALLGACANDAPGAAAPPAREPASSEVFVSAVDAASGAPLKDQELTVRYLVRAPITLDASALEKVPAAQPYRIVHSVAEDSLVVELRLEAPSYQRADTVISVARGATGSTVKVALAPRTAGAGSARAAPAPGGAGAQPPPSVAAAPAEADDPADAAADLSGLSDGDGAFSRGDWRGALAGYRRLAAPRARRGPYARKYEQALVRAGIAQINLGQLPNAYEALKTAVDYGFRDYTAYFYLGQVQCSLGEFDAGRSTLGQVVTLQSTISAEQRPIVLALIDYQRGVCSHEEFKRARSGTDQQRTAARAIEELEAFAAKAEAMRPPPPQIQAAADDARSRVRQIAGR